MPVRRINVVVISMMFFLFCDCKFLLVDVFLICSNIAYVSFTVWKEYPFAISFKFSDAITAVFFRFSDAILAISFKFSYVIAAVFFRFSDAVHAVFFMFS